MKLIFLSALVLSSLSIAATDRKASTEEKKQFCKRVEKLVLEENGGANELVFKMEECLRARITVTDYEPYGLGIEGDVPFFLQGLRLRYPCSGNLTNGEIPDQPFSCAI